MGANLLVASGRPINCIGAYGDRSEHGYGASYFSCDPGEPDANQDNGHTIVPRGTMGTTPWLRTLDLNVVYKPSFAEGLQFKVDVFNVFNEQVAVTVDEFGENSVGAPTPETYGRATGYNAPRSVRFMVQYDF